MIGFGLTETEVCQIIKNPQTGKPLDEKTLRKYFAAEIAAGAPKIKAQVGNKIVATILGRDGGLANEHARAALMMFYARTRMGWKDTSVIEHTGKDGGPIKTENALHFISAALDKIAGRLAGNAPSDDPEDGSGEDPPQDPTG